MTTKSKLKTRLPKGVYLAFCPTGEGGGRDNSCSPANAGTGDLLSPGLKAELGLPQGVNAVRSLPSTALSRVAQIAVNADARQMLVSALAAARAAESETRRALRLDPQNAELRAQHNANGRATRAANVALQNHDTAAGIVTAPRPARQPRTRRQPESQRTIEQDTRDIERANRRVTRVREGLSRVQLRIQEQAAAVPIVKFTSEEESQFRADASDTKMDRPNAEAMRAFNNLTRMGSREAVSESMLGSWLVKTDASAVDRNRERWITAKFPFRTPSGRTFAISISGGTGVEDSMDLIFSDDNSSTGATGRGEAFHVFANVVPAVKAFVDRFKPAKISFSAAQESRFDLYDKLTETVRGLMPGEYGKRVRRDYGRGNMVRRRIAGEVVVRESRGGGIITLHRVAGAR